ncbi:hypothetical protein tinsulaeT_04580 [Thalassotalea insulae]|uniref:Uncharacterized protein n=1 Tax=Thalassotalea insulae TaxID=2056778 RepID=A0ABQ6GM93_9GAMM|nr:hypothetical protein [Thalassotalea insulae]GLX77118.1 hypothetical protein tinsulaeT_04580 [Thalassotalea insulae]
MKILNTAIILALTLLYSNLSQATEEKIYSAMGYPYQLLLTRTESVKIIYSENNDNIACKVEVSWADKYVLTEPTQVSHKNFNEKPLANCLPRKTAKSILSQTFE